MDLTFRKDKIEDVVHDLWTAYPDRKVWAFHGEMGSGKTTLIGAICRSVGVISTVASPTYAIIHEYNTREKGPVFHMDWYRLKDEDEAVSAGVEDAIYSDQLCFIEWPEKAAGLLPEHTLHLYLQVLDHNARQITTVVGNLEDRLQIDVFPQI